MTDPAPSSAVLHRLVARMGRRAGRDGLPRIVGSIASLVPSVRPRLAVLGLFAFFGGLIEAAVLVLIAQVAVASADARAEVSLAGIELSVAQTLEFAAVLLAGRALLLVFSTRFAARAAAHSITSVRRLLVGGFLRASWHTRSRESPGELQDLLTTHTDRASLIVISLSTLVTAILNIVVLTLIALTVDPLAALTIVGTAALLGLAMRPLLQSTRRNAVDQAVKSRSFAATVTEAAHATREIQTFAVGDQVLAQVDRASRAYAARYQRGRHLALLTPQLFQIGALAVLLGGLAIARSSSSASLSTAGAVVLLLLRSLGYGQQAQSAYQAASDALPFLDEISQAVTRFESTPARRGGRDPGPLATFELRSVDYEYQVGRPVLRDVSFSFGSAEAIGIIGPSGSGKTTLLELLLGLREPTRGALLIDGLDLRNLDAAQWWRRIAFVPQDPILIRGSIAANIAFHRDLPQESIRKAAEDAHILEEIERLPAGFDEMLGASDARLSGGQRQRICIARALAGAPDLLIPDEPTSALDLRSEAMIQRALGSLHGKKTLVIVAHRLSTVARCDRVLVLVDGKVQAFDSHENLLRTSPFYAEVLALSITSGQSGADDGDSVTHS